MHTETRLFIGLATRPSVERRLMGPAGSRPKEVQSTLGMRPAGNAEPLRFSDLQYFLQNGNLLNARNIAF